MICVSVSDLQLITELSGMSEFDIISIYSDEKVAKYLYKIGVDTDFPWTYSVNIHRNLRDQVVMGFRIYGEIRCDASYRDSYMAGITERLVISSYKDRSFMEEIADLSFKVRDFSEYLNDSDSIEFDEERALFGSDQLEPDWELNTQKLQELENILYEIRGPAYNSAGALKSMKEYQEFAENRSFYEEKYDTN